MRDFLHKTDGDIDLSGGDIVMTDATLQHQRDIIMTVPGELKHEPLRGVGAVNYLNDDSSEDFMRKTRQEFVKDGMKIKSISQNIDGSINTEAYYEADYNG